MKTTDLKNRKIAEKGAMKRLASIIIFLAIFVVSPATETFGQSDTTTKKYDKVGAYKDDGFAKVTLNKKEGLIDKSGKEVIPCKYNQIYEVIVIYKNGHESCYFVEGFANANLDGKYGYINEKGKEITPFKYDKIEHFNNGRGKVKYDGKYGYIDENGKEVIPLKYDDANSFSYEIASVKLDDKLIYIDTQGNEYATKKAAKKAVAAAKKRRK
jgi:hypothetical protein